jgi:hypothetical protein
MVILTATNRSVSDLTCFGLTATTATDKSSTARRVFTEDRTLLNFQLDSQLKASFNAREALVQHGQER